jgi:hypothetical protein
MAWSCRLRSSATQLRSIEIKRVITAGTIDGILIAIGGREETESRQ